MTSITKADPFRNLFGALPTQKTSAPTKTTGLLSQAEKRSQKRAGASSRRHSGAQVPMSPVQTTAMPQDEVETMVPSLTFAFLLAQIAKKWVQKKNPRSALKWQV